MKEYTNKNTHIVIYYISDAPNIDIIMKILTFFRTFTNSKEMLELIIYYGNQKKYLPKEPLITPENINSGCKTNNTIYIWRKEEFYKVLIHELVHFFVLDFCQIDDTNRLQKLVNKLLNIQGKDIINEAYTEILALTIYSKLIQTQNNQSFDSIINYENIMTHLQIAKIIKLFGRKNIR